jgi:hypothetical protein
VVREVWFYHRFGYSRENFIVSQAPERISMAPKWWTRDLKLFIAGLLLTVFSILFVLGSVPLIQRLVGLGLALLFGACTVGCALPLMGLVPKREGIRVPAPRTRPAFKVSGPVITSVKGLGEMRQHSSFPDWLCSEPVRVELFEGKLLPFIIETEEVDLVSSRESIESAVTNFLALNADRRSGITELVYRNYEHYREVWDPPPPEVKDPSDVWMYIYPGEVFVTQGLEDKDFYIKISGDCEWEPEHGLEMVFKHGDQVVSVGQQGEWC